MPSSSPKQARFMAAIAHNPGFAKKVGVSQAVGRDFNMADAGTGILSGPRSKAPLRKIGHLSGYGQQAHRQFR
jgi:hypothetical protein